MHRIAFARVGSVAPRLLSASRRAVARPCHQVRLESTQAPSPKDLLKQALQRNDNMQRDWDAPVLTYEQVKAKTFTVKDAYLIDVREPDEVIQGSIPSAVNLPLSVLGTSLHLTREAFKEKHGFEKPKRDQEIVFNLFNYSGSWLDWIEREGIKAA